MERDSMSTFFICISCWLFCYKVEHFVNLFPRKTKDKVECVRQRTFCESELTYYFSIDRSELNSTSLTFSETASNCSMPSDSSNSCELRKLSMIANRINDIKTSHLLEKHRLSQFMNLFGWLDLCFL